MDKAIIIGVLTYCERQQTNALVCIDRRHKNGVKVLDKMWNESRRLRVIDEIPYDEITDKTHKEILSLGRPKK